MKQSATARTTDADDSSQSRPYKYQKVLDNRKQPIRGLWNQIQLGEINLRAMTLPDPQNKVWREGKLIDHPGDLGDERFAIFEIDYTEGDKVIVNQFRHWLENHRGNLQKRFSRSPATETVRTHVKNICQKMHVHSGLEAVAKYSELR